MRPRRNSELNHCAELKKKLTLLREGGYHQRTYVVGVVIDWTELN